MFFFVWIWFAKELPPEHAVRMADIRRSSAGYTADIRHVTDGICKLRKTYTENNYIY